jgi:hypothetical protein
MINRNKDLILLRVILLFIYKILYIKIINLFLAPKKKIHSKNFGEFKLLATKKEWQGKQFPFSSIEVY